MKASKVALSSVLFVGSFLLTIGAIASEESEKKLNHDLCILRCKDSRDTCKAAAKVCDEWYERCVKACNWR